MTILRKALLGSAALAVMATGAQADELSTLKAQLEALQNRVDTMEAAPAPSYGDKSLLTFERGEGTNTWGAYAAQDTANVGTADNGFTIGITPTADMPAPVAEITVYGYVAAHVKYDFDGNYGAANSFSVSAIGSEDDNGEDHISLTAKQSRFGIKSKIDTAIGQIRTQIEMDFNTAGNGGSLRPRLRHAVGHWDMTPNWTFTAGQYWYTAAMLPIGVSTVDFNGPLQTYSRTPQLRLTYTDGPLSWAVAVENPTFDSSTNMPNFASFLQYDIAGGHSFIISGEVADWEGASDVELVAKKDATCELWGANLPDVAMQPACDRAQTVLGTNTVYTPGVSAIGIEANDELGWAIQAGANFNLADVATLTGSFGYGAGLLSNKFMFEDGFNNLDINGDPLEVLAFVVGLSFGLSETTTFNVMGSYGAAQDDQGAVVGYGTTKAGQVKDEMYKVTANIMWQPVKQMRMGWEINYGKWEGYEWYADDATLTDLRKEKVDGDGFSAIFGTWFFF